MSAADPKEAVERRTDEAFAASAWEDPRADYRGLMRRLREHDAAAFEAAISDYEATVVEPLRDTGIDPVAAWLAYGERLAARVGGGRTVRIDREGRSKDAPDGEPAHGASSRDSAAGSRQPGVTDPPPLLLHLPADETTPAIVVARPRQPSNAQAAAVALLAEGRTALQSES